MENLGTLSPKLTLYWATLKKWFKPHLLEKYLYFGIFLEIILQFYVAYILASFITNWKLIKALSGNAIWPVLANARKVIFHDNQIVKNLVKYEAPLEA